MNALFFSLCRVTKRHERTKKSALMSKKGKNFVGQPLVFWEMKNESQCFGEEKELDDTSEGRVQTLLDEWRMILGSRLTRRSFIRNK